MTFAKLIHKFTPHLYNYDMDTKKKLPPISQAEKSALCEELFRRFKIAVINRDYVCEIRQNGNLWERKAVSRKFFNSEVVVYTIKNYLIVFLPQSEAPIVMQKFDYPIELSSIGGTDFFVKHINGNLPRFEKYCWSVADKCYYVTDLGNDVPAAFKALGERGIEHEWRRIYYHKNSCAKSIDNTMFYDYIAKLWEE